MSEPRFIVLYGTSGVGKTSMALTAPGPRLLLDLDFSRSLFDSGYSEWDGNGDFPDGDTDTVVRPENVHDVVQQSRVHPWGNRYRTVVLDTFTTWQERLMRTPALGDPDVDGFKYWRNVKQETDAMTTRLRQFVLCARPVNVVVLCQLAELYDESGEVSGYGPRVKGAGRNKLVETADLVGYLALGAKSRRLMFHRLTDRVTAKTRSKAMSAGANPLDFTDSDTFLADALEGWE